MASLAKLTSGAVHEPLHIVIAGNSTALFVIPPRTSRDQGSYPELLPRQLAEHGVTAAVTQTGKWFDMANNLRRRYEHAVRNHSPDVLVLNYGIIECQPNVVPTWLARHFSSWDLSSAPLPRAYRRWLAPTLWRFFRRLQQVVARRVTGVTWRLSPARFAIELRRVIQLAREQTGCLVLVLDIDPPGPRLEHWLPGMTQRRDRYQAVLHDLVTDLGDDQVRLVPASRTITEQIGFDAGLPDGIHRTALGHVQTANLLTAQILDWLSR